MLNQEQISLIIESRMEGVRLGKLPDIILHELYARNWFNIWVPKIYGGLEMPLADGCRLLESLAYWDGALGWTVTLCSGANMFSGFIDPNIARSVFSNREVCFGGSGRASGRAVPIDGGYRLTGRWSYATGAPHLSHFTCNAVVEINGAKGTEPIVKSFFVEKDQVLIDHDWITFGLKATASHSFELQDVFVPTTQSFDLTPEKATHGCKLFQYPFQQFAEFTLFVNYLGMFSRYCDLVQKEFFLRSKDQDWVDRRGKSYFKLLGRVEQFAEDSRKYIYAAIEKSWDELQNGEADQAIYEEVSRRTRADLRSMRNFLMDLHVKCGIKAAQEENELNLVFCNFFTATQHALLQDEA